MPIEEVLATTAHRPWPLPLEPWVMTMCWYDLLFAHWPVPVQAVRPHIPSELEIDTYDGQAWIGVVPFRMSDVRPRLVPPALSLAFPELNVRTYVTVQDAETGEQRPGVWFFSLDTTSFLSVRAARWFYSLPYFDASMAARRDGDLVSYISRRKASTNDASLTAGYRRTGPPYHADPRSLDHWLTERYRLYTAVPLGKVAFAEIHHMQWPLQKADAHIAENTMVDPLGIKLPDHQPLLHFAEEQQVVAWRIRLL